MLPLRETHEARLHENYERLQAALHELLSLQRRHKPKPAAADGDEHLPLETRIGLAYNALEKALAEWKRTLRQTNQLPVAAWALTPRPPLPILRGGEKQ